VEFSANWEVNGAKMEFQRTPVEVAKKKWWIKGWCAKVLQQLFINHHV
jgi:hypothetical protein